MSYPAGTYGVAQNGAIWWVPLGGNFERATFSYRIRFTNGFDWPRGGKLPGLAGGRANTGGHPSTGLDGWSARNMWKKDNVIQYVSRGGVERSRFGRPVASEYPRRSRGVAAMRLRGITA